MKADAPEELRAARQGSPAGGHLFRKYVLAFVGLVGVVLAVNGALDAWFDYGQAKETATRLQTEKAESAAERIALFVAEIERQIGWTTHAQWAAGTVEQRRFDYVRLLRQVPAITELVQLDAEGREQLKVSRLAMDVVGSGIDHSAEPRFREAIARKIWFSPVYFRKDSEPYLTMAVARSGRNAGVTVAEVNLKLIWDVITTIKVGEAGYAFVVDGSGRLIAHPDISLVLRNTDFSALPQVAAARQAVAARAPASAPMTVAAPGGGPEVLSAFAPTDRLGWLVFVELPLREALAPLRKTLYQSLAVFAGALALSALAGLLLARKMVGPIRQLEAGAARLGGGDLRHRITVRTGDELERLGDRFNAMAGRLQESYADLEQKVEDRTRELSASLKQQTATADVLKVISRAAFDLDAVLHTLVSSVLDLCHASGGNIHLRDGEVFRPAMQVGWPPEFLEYMRRNPVRAGRGSVSGRAVLTRSIVQIPDVLADPDYALSAGHRIAGYRTVLGVPLIRDGEVVGIFSLGRDAVDPFTDREIELVQTFADQAVIAIENVRLFDEVQARTRELQESLEYQTATSEVLNVISRSQTDVRPVFGAILDCAVGLCGADQGGIFQVEDGQLVVVEFHPSTSEAWAVLRENYPRRVDLTSLNGRSVLEAGIVHVPDLQAPDAPVSLSPVAIGLGIQAQLSVPLLSGGQPIGVLSLQRRTPAPFSAAQIELVTTFADQAVIAIKNVRLFDEVQARTRELQESLEYQTATSDVLKAISRSVVELQPVLDEMVETAARLCRADKSFLFRLDRDLYRLKASFGFSEEFKRFIEENPIAPDAAGTVVGRTAMERRPVHYRDVTTDERYQWTEAQAFGGFRTALGVPLLRNGEPIGVLIVSRDRVEPFSAKQIDLVTTFADQAVIAIENVRLFDELQARTSELARSVEELQTLGETGQAVSGTLDLGRVLDLVASRAVALGPADGCALFRYERSDRTFSLWRAKGLATELVEAIRRISIREDETAMGRALHERQPVIVPDLREASRWPLSGVSVAAGLRTTLIVPLIRAERKFGALVLFRKGPMPFEPRTVDLMQTFANQSVLAIQNARLFREIEEKGRQLAIASQHKSQFLANMSHELRTPLNAVLGYTELLSDGLYGELPDKANGVLARVQANGQHLLALINDVLDLSKIEAGQLVLSLDDYAMPSLVRSVVTVAEPLAKAKGLTLDVSVAEHLPVGRGDERRLTQVLLNLVGNAVKFTDSGSVAIAAWAADQNFALTVTDTGPGIAPDDQARIFDAFQQVDNTSTRKKGGTGLGLAISKRIVEMHGGSLTVESAPGRGSTFRLTVPVRVELFQEVAE